MPPPTKLFVIPLEGYFIASDFYCRTDQAKAGRKGKCEVCDEEFTHLSAHFQKHHSTPNTRFKSRFVKLVDSLSIPAKEVHPANGLCGLCESENGDPVPYQQLKKHFLEDHLQGKWLCPVCGQKRAPTYQLRHLQSHSGMVKCLVEGCTSHPESYYAALVHLYRYHTDILYEDRHKYIADLTDEEYKAVIIQKAKANGKWKKKNAKPNVDIIRGLGKKLEVYYNDRLRKEPVLTNKIDILFKKFTEYFNVPYQNNDIVLVKNSAFISLWSVKLMTPILVFQRIPKTAGMKQLQAATFHPDPQVAKLNQPKNDSFLHSGYAKGHMAPGADYRVLEEFIQSHYYANICAQRRYLNWIVRPYMEHYLRQKANSQDDPVFAAHFPIMEGGIPTTLNGIRIADSFGCVLLSEERQGHSIIGWKLYNNDNWQDFKDCTVDPFSLFGKTSISFRKTREDFVTIHSTTPEIAVTPPPSSTPTSTPAGRTISSSSSSSSSNTATPSSTITSIQSIDADEVHEVNEKEMELAKSDLTQLVEEMEMGTEDKVQKAGGKDNSRKRSQLPSTSPSPILKRKKKVYVSPKMPPSVDSGISFGVTPYLSPPADLDPEADDFKMPTRPASRNIFFNVFRRTRPGQQQLSHTPN